MARTRRGPFPPTRAQMLDAARREALVIALDGRSGAELHRECGSHPALRWHCLQSHLGAERLAARECRNQGFPVFLPTAVFYRGRRFVAAPLVPRYFFAQFDAAEAPWRALLHTRGVHRMFLIGDRPAPARRGSVEAILERVEGDLATGVAAPSFQAGQRAQIARGVYAGWSSPVQWASPTQVGLRLRMFGREIDVTMEAEDVRAVAS